MALTLFHFIGGSLGALAVFLLVNRLSGATGFSAPFGVIFVGIACAALSHFLSPWATPVIIALYALASFAELYQERKARKEWESRQEQK
jgi:membrane protein implicated in regulation of membrane protease activity